MKKLLSILLIPLILSPAAVTANPVPWGGVGLYTNATGTGHYISDAGGLAQIYVVTDSWHQHVAVMFSAAPQPCFVATFLGDNSSYTTIGDSQTGIIIDLGECLIGPTHVLTMTYFLSGQSGECCFYYPSPHPDYPDFVAIRNCNDEVVPGGAGAVVINPDPQTYCGTIPVEMHTWGGIKALYHQ